MLITLMIMNSLLFNMMKHPMSAGIMLLIQTVITSMVTTTISKDAWFSYILFLVFLGGMLVLFIYMTSVASNEMFQKGNIMVLPPMIIILMIMYLMIDFTWLMNNTEEIYYNFMSEKVSLSTSLFNYPNNIMTTVAVLYLFLTLIVVVKITESYLGPIRSIN
uniref:NADH-ubiquinone oxidoreductase chain 6 n=1 Tax=Mesopodagrion tibetanum TaxID=1407349 RepID=A0A6C0R252_9ODON|nr:NADH dehydrogenase subunit 6 [Mesopodagrion tibetanum]